jgi:two-component system chemotaxis response regulator CheB
MVVTMDREPLRLLVVDDSAYNRRSIAETVAASPEVKVVGKAADGEEALRLVSLLKPDVITLDLEMPRMDGFTFLRILMSKMPTPVVVVSSYSQKENVFKALELGALDFVAKPDRYADAELASVRDELVQKILLARTLRNTNLMGRRVFESLSGVESERAPVQAPTAPPRYLVAIASSTGGPSALMEIFTALPPRLRDALLVAQHMPDKFTRTFADRLDRRSMMNVSEAQDLAAIGETTAFVCPGRKCMEVELVPGSASSLRVRVRAPDPEDRYVPSADRLLSSVAEVAGRRAVGIILTGMGDDGVQGARDIVERGGIVVAESESTAVVYGMPGSAVRAGVVSQSLPLGEIANFIAGLGG